MRGGKKRHLALRCLWKALGGESIIGERTVSIQHKKGTDISHHAQFFLDFGASNSLSTAQANGHSGRKLQQFVLLHVAKQNDFNIELRVTQSGEQTTSSNEENTLYSAYHLLFSMREAIFDLLRLCGVYESTFWTFFPPPNILLVDNFT